jgi:carbon monoxide dehydrogenase subunit G
LGVAHAERSVVVDRPIAEVFAFLADPTNEQSWRRNVTSIRHVSGSGVGAQYAQTVKGPGGRSIAADFRLTRIDEPTRIDFEVTAGPARPTGYYLLRDSGGGSTEVTYSLDLTLTGAMKLMAPLINSEIHAEVANLDNLPSALRSDR